MSDYQPHQNKESSWGGSSYALIRAVSIFCLTIFLIAALFMLFAYNGDRFSIFSGDQGLYIFDKKNIDVSYCTSDGKCTTTFVKPQELPPLIQEAQHNISNGFMSQNSMPANPQDVAYCQAVMQNSGAQAPFGMTDPSAQMQAAQQFVGGQSPFGASNNTATVIPAPFPVAQDGNASTLGAGTLLPAGPSAPEAAAVQPAAPVAPEAAAPGVVGAAIQAPPAAAPAAPTSTPAPAPVVATPVAAQNMGPSPQAPAGSPLDQARPGSGVLGAEVEGGAAPASAQSIDQLLSL